MRLIKSHPLSTKNFSLAKAARNSGGDPNGKLRNRFETEFHPALSHACAETNHGGWLFFQMAANTSSPLRKKGSAFRRSTLVNLGQPQRPALPWLRHRPLPRFPPALLLRLCLLHRFEIFNQSGERKRALALNARIITLKRLHKPVMSKIDAASSSFWAAKNRAANNPGGLGLLERQRVKFWLRDAFVQLDTVEIQTPASPPRPFQLLTNPPNSFSLGSGFQRMNLTEQMTQLARQAKAASRELARLTTGEKNACLLAMATALEQNAAAIKKANALDLDFGAQQGLSSAMLDRLKLDDKRIAGMARGLREVAVLPDPVGRILDERIRPNGLKLQKISTPIGVIVIIYESRPNVTADAASLCFKSGNATILRGGREALNSNQLIAKIMIAAGKIAHAAFPEHAIQVVPTPDREAIPILLSLTQYVDLCMPRGGEGLIRAVTACSKVPVIKHYKGVCHVFVDAEADLHMAGEIAMNAKVQRPAVCNAMETLLVDKPVAGQFLPAIAARLFDKHVEIRGDETTLKLLEASRAAHPAARLRSISEQDYFTEYNDYILNVRVVDGVQAAVDHINYYGSAHSDSIVTANEAHARQFLAQVDSAAVYWNASTRFTDGGEFGMGAEIGISTDKIGARGPMGLDELTSYKWLGIGTGQVRS